MATKTFISYRRDGGEVMAQLVFDRLIARGLDVFYDIESLKSGAFDVKLYKEIDECDNFLLILPPNGLDRCVYEEDWVRKEISHALKKNKNIIPLMLRGFQFPENLPDDIKKVSMYQGIKIDNMDFFDAKIDKLVSMLTPDGTVAKPVLKLPNATNTSTLIGQVRSIASSVDNDHSPVGKYSTVISTRNLRSICFHVYFKKRYEKEKQATLLLKIYDALGQVVLDESYSCKVLTTYDSVSVVWKVGSDNGCLINEGPYRAEFILDNAGVFTYNFTVTSEKTHDGVKTAVGRKLASIESSLGLSKHSLTYTIWVIIVVLAAVGVGMLLHKVSPNWWDNLWEFLNTPATEWFKKD